MEIEEHQIKEHPRTRFTLENFLRMDFHLTGCRDFMEGVNYGLGLGSIQSKFNKLVGTSFDATKYIFYASTIGLIAYEIFKR